MLWVGVRGEGAREGLTAARSASILMGWETGLGAQWCGARVVGESREKCAHPVCVSSAGECTRERRVAGSLASLGFVLRDLSPAGAGGRRLDSIQNLGALGLHRNILGPVTSGLRIETCNRITCPNDVLYLSTLCAAPGARPDHLCNSMCSAFAAAEQQGHHQRAQGHLS